MVAHARALLDHEHFRWMMDVLRNESPANRQLPLNAGGDVRAAFQSQTEGYVMALANIEAMGVLSHTPDTLEATFEPEETNTEHESK